MALASYKVEFIESGKTYLDERIFDTPEEAAIAGWHYADNLEAISGVQTLQIQGDWVLSRWPIDQFSRTATAKSLTVQPVNYQDYLMGRDVQWNDHPATGFPTTARVLDMDKHGILLCQYVYPPDDPKSTRPSPREDGPILFFTWHNLPPLTVLGKQPTE